MEQDICAKRFFSSNERYADLINGLACQGRQVVQKEDLQELDTQTGVWKMKGFGRRGRKRRGRARDLLRRASFGMNFAVIGIENQEEIDYALPLRTLSYDVSEYERQAAIIKRKIRGNRGGLDAGEYLYGFSRESRLYPTVTLVLYYGKKKWDASRDLYGILDFSDIPEELKELVQNYRIQVVEVRELTDTSVFHTDVRQVFDFIRCSHDSKKLKELVEGNPEYQAMDEDAYDMAGAYAQARKLIQVKHKYRKDGKVNMCEGLEALVNEGKAEGITEGRAEGEESFARLTEKLLADSRIEDLKRATGDKEFRKRLYKEYHLNSQ